MKPIIALVVSLISICVHARDMVSFDVEPSSNLPLVDVYINNDTIPFRFVLDTGCSAVIASGHNGRLVSLLNLCETDTIYNGNSISFAKKTPSECKVRIGDTTVENLQILCDDDPALSYDGVIGLSFLKNFKFAILSDVKMLVFCSNEEPLRIPNSIQLPLIPAHLVYGTKITIVADSCKQEGTFMLDTGFGSTVCLTSDFYKNDLASGLKPFHSVSVTDGAGVDSKEFLATAPRILFAGEALPLFPVMITPHSSDAEWMNHYNGIIGYDLLRRFNMIWDFNNSILYIAPNLDFFSPFALINR